MAEGICSCAQQRGSWISSLCWHGGNTEQASVALARNTSTVLMQCEWTSLFLCQGLFLCFYIFLTPFLLLLGYVSFQRITSEWTASQDDDEKLGGTTKTWD